MKLRKARLGDTEVVIDFLLVMLNEMASLGGHPIAEGSSASDWLRERFIPAIDDPDHLLLLAESEDPEANPIGLVEASITQPHPVFRTKRMLHIHSIYVGPDYRRKGVARRLIEAALQWGRAHDCVEAELNALEGNPARHLYESLGFRVFEFKMRRRL
jgi:GNAT superfamily N-acetyltransferase